MDTRVHIPLTEDQKRSLKNALARNLSDGTSLLLDRRDTSFVGIGEKLGEDAVPTKVIDAVASNPSHY